MSFVALRRCSTVKCIMNVIMYNGSSVKPFCLDAEEMWIFIIIVISFTSSSKTSATWGYRCKCASLLSPLVKSSTLLVFNSSHVISV